MPYQVLARKWRPQNFEDVIGQDHITRTLQNAIKTNRIGQAYLFTGPRGVGKTTTARILAKALNCEKGPTPHPCNRCSNCIEITENRFPDVIEIDGASNNSVDDVRELIEKINYRPVKGRYRIYIIDEVHMLSISAFNALLKTLEEPPPHVIFVFATTEPHKIPATIISRCQRFDFRKIPEQLITARIKEILKEEGITDIPEESLRLVSKAADGSLRDALSILDQLIALDPGLSPGNIRQILGITGRSVARDLITSIVKRDTGEVARLLAEEILGRIDIKNFLRDLLTYLDELLKMKLAVIQPEEDEKALLNEVSQEELFHLFNGLNDVAKEVLASPFPEIKFEVAILALTARPPLTSIEKLIEILSSGSEKRITNPPRPSSPPTFSRKESRGSGSSPTPNRETRTNRDPFEELKQKLLTQKPGSLPLIGVMKFNRDQNSIIINVLSGRQRDALEKDPQLIDFIKSLAEKYLNGADVVVEDKLQKKSHNNSNKSLFTLKDVEDSEVLKKLIDRFEGRITKLIPDRR